MAYAVNQPLVTGCVVTAAQWNVGVNNDEYLKGNSGCVVIADMINAAGCALFSYSIAGSIAKFDFRNNDNTDADSHARVRAFIGGSTAGDAYFRAEVNSITGWNLGVDNSDSDLFKINDGAALGDANNFVMDTSGGIYINDTSNADVTIGLTINQAANTDDVIAAKANYVAHGMTSLVETDTFCGVGVNTACGGVVVSGYSEGTVGMALMGNAGDADVTRSSAALGAVNILGRKKSGTSVTNLGANGNILVISDLATGHFIFDADGDFHADAAVTASSFDAFNDVAAVRALELHRTPAAIVRDVFDEWVQYSRRDLESMKIATFNDQPGGDGSVFINYTALARLHSGALWQLHKRIVLIEQALSDPFGMMRAAVRARLVRARWWGRWHDLRRRLRGPTTRQR